MDSVLFALEHIAGLSELTSPLGIDNEVLRVMLEQAARFAEREVAPLNQAADKVGCELVDGRVRTPPGWPDVYRHWCSGGWNAVTFPEEWGGMGLPTLVGTVIMEFLTSACMAFGMSPVTTQGAAEALLAHGTLEQKRLYLPKLVSGEWTGTMCLTEPQSGSDLSHLRARAESAGDGSYRLFGQKAFISYGEHDLVDNIVHLVLARLPGAPQGTKGISLFVVPKRLVDPNGALGPDNDVSCVGLEHKMGIRASPTCTMAFGDHGGARAWLVGREHAGLACMFTMMNKARLATGLQGVAIAERAYRQALAYAHERRQGQGLNKGPGMVPIIEHPDVRRMLMTMRALIAAGRAICYVAAAAIDHAHVHPDSTGRARASERASLLTPVVKAFATDIGVEATSLALQVHGGLGYIEETGVAQHFRDARIAPIYEGTNGIQAIDLVKRKVRRLGGATAQAEIAGLRREVLTLATFDRPMFGSTVARLSEAIDALAAATEWMLAPATTERAALAVATPYLRLFGLASAGAFLAKGICSALRSNQNCADAIATTRFYAEHIATAAPGLSHTVVEGAEAVESMT